MTLGTLGSCSGLLAAVPSFDTIIQSDADITITVRSISELHERLEGHPFVALYESGGIKDLFAKFEIEEEVSDEPSSFLEVAQARFGLSCEDLLELFPGQLAISVDSMIDAMEGKLDRPDLMILAECTADTDRMQELMQIQFEHNAAEQKAVNPLMEHHLIERDFMGETLYLDETFDGENTYIEDAYALVDGVFVLASPVARLEAAVEAIKEGSRDSLERSQVYQRVIDVGGRGDVRLYCNLRSLLSPLKSLMAESQEMAGGMAMLGVTADSVWSAIGLDALDAFWMDADLIEDGAALSSGLLYSEKSGFLKMLAYENGTLPDAGYVPADALTSSVARFDITEMFAALEAILSTASPNMGQLLNLQLLNLQSTAGVDLRAAILNNFGDEMVSYTMLGDSADGMEALQGASTIYVISVQDTNLMAQGIDGLLAQAPMLKPMMSTEEFAGQTLNIFKNIPNPNMPEVNSEFSYVLTRSSLIFCTGPTSSLKSALTRMDQDNEGFWERADILDAFDRIGMEQSVGRVAYDFSDTGDAFVAYCELLGQSFMKAQGRELDLSDVKIDFPYLMLSETVEEADGLISKSLIILKEED